jgi:hypothetical protein
MVDLRHKYTDADFVPVKSDVDVNKLSKLPTVSVVTPSEFESKLVKWMERTDEDSAKFGKAICSFADALHHIENRIAQLDSADLDPEDADFEMPPRGNRGKNKPRKRTQKRQNYVVYEKDVQNIVDGVMYHDGQRVKALPGSLPEGEWTWRQRKADGNVEEIHVFVSKAGARQGFEALTTQSQRWEVGSVRHVIGDVLKEKNGVYEELSSCAVAWCGVVMNKHAYEECTHVRFGDKIYPRSAISHNLKYNSDLVVMKPIDGMPKGLPKRRFEEPALDQRVLMLNIGSNLKANEAVSEGFVKAVDEKGAHGVQLRVTNSTQPGDCGALYLNTNSSVVGFHFKRGTKGVDNLAIPVTAEFLQLQPKN